jgi:hypothetical protein
MFVPVIEVPNKGEGLNRYTRSVKPAARLYELNNCPHRRTQIGVDYPFEIRRRLGLGIPDGEVNLLRIGGNACGVFVFEHSPNQVIESASEVMNYIREHQGPAEKIGFPADMSNDPKCSAILVSFVDEVIRFKFIPPLNLTVESIEQFFSPS